jgi:hydrogenase expression/formation protein HypC
VKQPDSEADSLNLISLFLNNMCLAKPYRIKKIIKNWAWLENQKKVSLALVPQAKIGDWLLVHADLAVNILKADEAREILALVKNCPHD